MSVIPLTDPQPLDGPTTLHVDLSHSTRGLRVLPPVGNRRLAAEDSRATRKARDTGDISTHSATAASAAWTTGSGEVIGEVPSTQLARLQADEQVVA